MIRPERAIPTSCPELHRRTALHQIGIGIGIGVLHRSLALSHTLSPPLSDRCVSERFSHCASLFSLRFTLFQRFTLTRTLFLRFARTLAPHSHSHSLRPSRRCTYPVRLPHRIVSSPSSSLPSRRHTFLFLSALPFRLPLGSPDTRSPPTRTCPSTRWTSRSRSKKKNKARPSTTNQTHHEPAHA